MINKRFKVSSLDGCDEFASVYENVNPGYLIQIIIINGLFDCVNNGVKLTENGAAKKLSSRRTNKI